MEGMQEIRGHDSRRIREAADDFVSLIIVCMLSFDLTYVHQQLAAFATW